ncbi:hypothetical protein D3C72_1314310 [compost metagenome]
MRGGRLQRQVRVFRLRQLRVQKIERGESEEQENENRRQRPDNLDRRVMAGLGSHRIFRGAEFQGNDDEQRKNEKRNRNNEPQCILFKPAYFVHDRRGGLLHAHLPMHRLIGVGADSREQTGHPRQCCVNPIPHGTLSLTRLI